ncbi:membrane protein [Photobacterium aquae]|uniref:Membrane protein n=1 Tax=Photobacterium aquae TaxID=1195763 RepID=A0A0J1H0U1_9GAMM|nr:DUF2753 family protein [Photobacterium aquae]KLV05438.1 membrane protein [Photobacterium aquae]
MNTSRWEQHTLLADNAVKSNDFLMAVVHYQLALAESQQLEPLSFQTEELEDLLTIKVMSCHNLANFWQQQGDVEYELKYLQLASEQIMTLIPQCPRAHCESFMSSLGCCKSALIAFLKRHPNPIVAKQVENMSLTNQCELIAKFKLH